MNSTNDSPPTVFLLGPPGAGKTTLGLAACRELDLKFGRLPDSEDTEKPDELADVDGDVVEVPWSRQCEPRFLSDVRKAGEPLLLWVHPLEMEARSDSGRVLTPGGRAKTREGFGRRGTSCKEFRRFRRGGAHVADLIGLDLDAAREEVVAWIEALRDVSGTPVERAGIESWVWSWIENAHEPEAIRPAAERLAEAMAHYILELEGEGASRRKVSPIASDLQQAGLLVFHYERPTPDDVLEHFDAPPFTMKFDRDSLSRNLRARYRRSLRSFADFLERWEG